MTPPLSKQLARFRGTLIGALTGDCYGASFEFVSVDAVALPEQLENLSNLKHLKYTDDSSMTISTCSSLIENNGFNASHLARLFSETYFKDPPFRNYGGAVPRVFKMLRDTNYQNPFAPAQSQFGGQGSYGNGAAMRCSGIALFAIKKNYSDQETVELVQNCSRLTHSHPYGISGAVLVVFAIRYLINLDEDSPLDEFKFVDYLIKTISDLEPSNGHVFSEKLKRMRQVMEKLSITGTDTTQSEMVALLGNGESAQDSVPLAIYSFLRGVSHFTDSYRIDNEFLRTMHWAISCGGDTDTIASMGCALSGAYLGIDRIPESYYNKCESWKEVISLADNLAQL